MNDALKYAGILWDFNVLNQKLEKADYIIALGNSDIRTAQAVADLFKRGYGKAIVTTGGSGSLTKHAFVKPEAQVFADEAMELVVLGYDEQIVPEENIPNLLKAVSDGNDRKN